jgi:hypothetical protein
MPPRGAPGYAARRKDFSHKMTIYKITSLFIAIGHGFARIFSSVLTDFPLLIAYLLVVFTGFAPVAPWSGIIFRYVWRILPRPARKMLPTVP